MINYDLLLRDIVSKRVVGSSLAVEAGGKQIVDFIARYVEFFGQVDVRDPQTVFTNEAAGIYNIKVIDRSGQSKIVQLKFFSDSGLKFYGTSDELGGLEAHFDIKTGEPEFLDIIKEDSEHGAVYTTITREGYRTAYYEANERELQKMGISAGITPEAIEMTKDQIDGNIYSAAYMTHEAEAKKRFAPSHTR